MRILPNYVYKFTFQSNFSGLNGIYKVLQITSYEVLLTEGIDLFAILYADNGLDQTTFDADIATIRDKRILKLQDVSNTDVEVYIPEHIQSTIPNASVQQYMELGIACNIGVHEDVDDVTTLKTEIEQTIEAMIGEQNAAVVYTVDNKWLTAAEYAVIAAARAVNVSTVSNHYTDKVTALLEIDRLRTKITYYEDLIKTL